MRRALIRLCQRHGVCTRSLSSEAASLVEPVLLSPEVVAFVTNRGQGTIALPAELTSAMEKALARREGPHKALQKASTDLTGELRDRSRTRGKGGSRLMPHKEAERRVPEEPSRSELKHMLKKLVAGGPMPADRVDTAADQVHASSDSRRKTRRHQEPSVSYDDLAAAAYAVSRMPACYAVVKRIMEEIAFSQSDWRPHTMLDFGAGPATAAWAAAEVWGGSPQLEIQAVEPSNAMAELGHEMGQELSEGRPAIRWSSSLPGLHPSHRFSKGSNEHVTSRLSKRHDLVTACYVLSEIEDASQRRRVVESLWQTTGDTLLIAEPGTPIGSAIVREARWQILSLEGAAGAHVQAPCPHDGVCPMDGSRSWCHFRQRFQRPPLQRRYRRPANSTAPRSYQDERFSYVVLKRGPRPQPIEAAISGAALDEVSLEDAESPPAPSASSQTLQQQEDTSVGEGEEDSDWDVTDDELRLLDPETRQLVLESMASGSDSNSDSGDEEREPVEAIAPSIPPATQDMDRQDLMLEAATGSHADLQQARQPDVSAASSSTDPSTPLEGAEQNIGSPSRQSHRQGGANPVSAADCRPAEPDVEATNSNVDFDDALLAANSDSSEADSEAEEEELFVDEVELETAKAASRSWSRVVRKPRTRHRHVILDVCAAKRTAAGQSPCEGQLLQQVVGKADIAWAGAKGYRIARKARWGDLWPTFFQDQAIVVTEKDSGSLGK